MMPVNVTIFSHMRVAVAAEHVLIDMLEVDFVHVVFFSCESNGCDGSFFLQPRGRSRNMALLM